MRHSTVLVASAGAALVLSASAFAQSADQVRAYEGELLADSAGRTSLLGAANGNGVKVGGQVQFRFIANGRDDVPAPDEDFTSGFQTRRTKIWVDANVTEEWSAKIVGAFSRSNGNFVLEDVIAKYKANDNTDVQFGQFKLPMLREESVSSTSQLAADRSPMNATFTQGRSQGIMLTHTADDFRVFFAFSDGLNTANTEFNSMAEADWAFTGRGEYKWAGDWKQFRDFTSFQNSENAGMVGVAAHYQGGGSTGGPTADFDVIQLTADVSFEGNGWNAFGAVVWRNTDPGSGGDSFDDIGVLVQGGWFMNATWELFGRFDAVIADGDRPGDPDDFYTITAGVNHYLIENSHAAKVTVDLQYFLDAQADGIVAANPGIGLLGSGEDGQWALRGQLQLVLP